MSIDPKFIELTAVVGRKYFLKIPTDRDFLKIPTDIFSRSHKLRGTRERSVNVTLLLRPVVEFREKRDHLLPSANTEAR